MRIDFIRLRALTRNVLFNSFGRHFFALLIIFCTCVGCKKIGCHCEMNEATAHLSDSLKKVYVRPNDFDKYWAIYDEPLLEEGKGESYRLSMKYTFYDYCKIYRIQNIDDRYVLFVKEYAVATTNSSKHHDSLVSSYSRNIQPAEWMEFKEKIDSFCLWTMLMVDNKIVMDGSRWMFEGFDPDASNCADTTLTTIFRSSPDDPRFLGLCEGFFKFDPLVVKQF